MIEINDSSIKNDYIDNNNLSEAEDDSIANSSLMDDFRTALINAQFTFVILIALSLLYMYQITVAPYKFENYNYNSKIPDDYDKLVIILLNIHHL